MSSIKEGLGLRGVINLLDSNDHSHSEPLFKIEPESRKGTRLVTLPHQTSFRHLQRGNSLSKFHQGRLERSNSIRFEALHNRYMNDNILTLHLNSTNSNHFDDIIWPISIHWPSDHPKCIENKNNTEGDMDIDMLLRFSIDHIINLPYRTVLLTCIRIKNIQQYFILLFWYMKLILFENQSNLSIIETVSILKHYLSREFEVASACLDVETKDKMYTFLPLLLCNGIFFGYFYLIAGSKHIYTESFHQTLYKHIVEIMYGIDLPLDAVIATFKNYILDDTISRVYYYGHTCASNGLDEDTDSECGSARVPEVAVSKPPRGDQPQPEEVASIAYAESEMMNMDTTPQFDPSSSTTPASLSFGGRTDTEDVSTVAESGRTDTACCMDMRMRPDLDSTESSEAATVVEGLITAAVDAALCTSPKASPPKLLQEIDSRPSDCTDGDNTMSSNT